MTMEKIKKTIKSKLSKFREEEKGDAMAILMFIGLKHYSLLYPDQPYVQMSYLKFLTGECDTAILTVDCCKYSCLLIDFGQKST